MEFDIDLMSVLFTKENFFTFLEVVVPLAILAVLVAVFQKYFLKSKF